MGSSRFPGKPMRKILGIPMVEHVLRRVQMCDILDEVYVATCDQEIFDYIESIGAKAIMTSDQHERASDRVAEANETIGADFVVLVQGDEPMTTPEMVADALTPMLNDASIDCVNLRAKITTQEEFEDRNTIKVVMNVENDATYFSREPIPHTEKIGFDSAPKWKQVCIIPFTKDSLAGYATLEPTPLEVSESVDMMRFVEHGYKVRMIDCTTPSHAVDTESDRVSVESIMKNDPLVNKYLSS
jgi:3-deoxy-manno-octulosonate cytidylyltransferase (CMP-KDO synthetase)